MDRESFVKVVVCQNGYLSEWLFLKYLIFEIVTFYKKSWVI